MTGAGIAAGAATTATAGRRAAAVPWRALLAHEWRLLRAERLMPRVLVLFALVCGVAVWSGQRAVQARAGALAAARQADDAQRARWVGIVDTITTPPAGPFARDPRMPMFVAGGNGGTVAGLDLLPLAALGTGQSDLLPTQHKIAVGTRESVLGVTELENPANLLTGRFDLAFVVVALFPLVILALSYSMISGEQEDGTLALTLAQPVTVRAVLLAKVAVRAGVVVGLALAVVLAGAAVVGVPLADAEAMARVGWWAMVVITYGLFWFGVAMVVGLRVRSSAASALTLAAIWLAVTVVAPSLTNIVAQVVHPAPSRVALISAMRTATNEANAASDKVLAKFAFDHPEMRPDTGAVDLRNFWNVSLSVTDTIEKQLAPFYTAFDAQVAEQQALVQRAALLSPALLVQQALEQLSGTDPRRWMAFRAQVVAFHQAWQGDFARRQFRRQQLTRADLLALPRFRFAEPGLGATLATVGPLVAWLAGLTVLCWVVALRSARRYRVAGD